MTNLTTEQSEQIAAASKVASIPSYGGGTSSNNQASCEGYPAPGSDYYTPDDPPPGTSLVVPQANTGGVAASPISANNTSAGMNQTITQASANASNDGKIAASTYQNATLTTATTQSGSGRWRRKSRKRRKRRKRRKSRKRRKRRKSRKRRKAKRNAGTRKTERRWRKKYNKGERQLTLSPQTLKTVPEMTKKELADKREYYRSFSNHFNNAIFK